MLSPPPTKGPFGMPMLDPGSTGGDCGYRAIALAAALTVGQRKLSAAQNSIEKLTASLRTKVHETLRATQDKWGSYLGFR